VTIDLKINFDPKNLIGKPAEIKLVLDRELANAARDIAKQAGQGIAADGQPFAPYAESTARARRKKGFQTSPVNLTNTGNMLRAITTKSEVRDGELEGTIFFANAQAGEIATYHTEGTEKMPVRNFFGLSDRIFTRIKNAIEKALLRK
jgi:hypothetical protein